ncbi:MAG: biotin transporter BioY [Mogibacterium sp.]|nr:biotin transporter BioY [Mogibacterium sp.]
MSSREAGGQKTLTMILMALFAAATGVLSWISLPLPFTPVPVNLALVGVLLAGNTLGFMGKANGGTYSMLIYIALGAMGVPVFSGGNAGAGVLVGPTGGFILGYVLAAFFAGHFCARRQGNVIVGSVLNMIAILLCYLPGIVWFVTSTGCTVEAGLVACVLPFLPGDALKSIVVALVCSRMSKLQL